MYNPVNIIQEQVHQSVQYIKVSAKGIQEARINQKVNHSATDSRPATNPDVPKRTGAAEPVFGRLTVAVLVAAENVVSGTEVVTAEVAAVWVWLNSE